MAPLVVAPEFVTTGLAHAPEFLLEAARALRGELFGGRSAVPVTTNLARDYFQARKRSGGIHDSDIVAFASKPYQRLLALPSMHSRFRSLSTADTVIDYGCGTGSLLLHLRRTGFTGHYVGVDVDSVAISDLQRRHSDHRTFFAAELPNTLAATLVVIANVLVYNTDDEARDILARSALATTSGGTVLVMEPLPRWYWEFVFNGIRLRARPMPAVERLMEGSGLIVERRAIVSLAKFGKRPILPIAYALTGIPRHAL